MTTTKDKPTSSEEHADDLIRCHGDDLPPNMRPVIHKAVSRRIRQAEQAACERGRREENEACSDIVGDTNISGRNASHEKLVRSMMAIQIRARMKGESNE